MKMQEINIGGRIFILPTEILNQIPHFTDRPNFIARSPILFEHVISFLLDPTYLFPIEYAYELDYYGIRYDKDKLYRQNITLFCGLDKKINTVNDNIVQINKNNLQRHKKIIKKIDEQQSSTKKT